MTENSEPKVKADDEDEGITELFNDIIKTDLNAEDVNWAAKAAAEVAGIVDDDDFMQSLADKLEPYLGKCGHNSPLLKILDKNNFHRAYEIAGSRKELARRLGISPATADRGYQKYEISKHEI